MKINRNTRDKLNFWILTLTLSACLYWIDFSLLGAKVYDVINESRELNINSHDLFLTLENTRVVKKGNEFIFLAEEDSSIHGKIRRFNKHDVKAYTLMESKGIFTSFDGKSCTFYKKNIDNKTLEDIGIIFHQLGVIMLIWDRNKKLDINQPCSLLAPDKL